jgi:hypothetical protein
VTRQKDYKLRRAARFQSFLDCSARQSTLGTQRSWSTLDRYLVPLLQDKIRPTCQKLCSFTRAANPLTIWLSWRGQIAWRLQETKTTGESGWRRSGPENLRLFLLHAGDHSPIFSQVLSLNSSTYQTFERRHRVAYEFWGESPKSQSAQGPQART